MSAIRHSRTGMIAVALTLVLAGSFSRTEGAEKISPWGIVASAEWFGEYPRFDPLVAQAGIRWFRAFPEWQTMQPRKGEWDWRHADNMLADMKKNDIGVTGCFCYFAQWATRNGDTRTSPIKDMQDWSNYVTGVVTRYKDDIQDWEVYNEFNGSFSNSKNKPKEYADLVVAAYKAAKKANPKARIGMSCANFDLGFFDSAIKEGAGGHFDFIAVHPYENLGTLVDGGEDGYLSMAGSIRKMLAEHKQRSDIALWITEFGMTAPVRPDRTVEAVQSNVLVKGHILALAQGFERICWFEIRGPSYGSDRDHGLIRHDWTPRPAYNAMKTMIGALGEFPEYVGWLDLDGGGYGFVFQIGEGALLSAWSPKGSERTISFSSDTQVMGVLGEKSELRRYKKLTLSDTPVYVLGLPAREVRQARANARKPFPWGGEFAKATEVSCVLGATNTDRGITQKNQGTTEVVNKLDHSYRSSHRKNSEGQYAYFRVDPVFATFGTTHLEITIVARRASGARTGVEICYESLTGYRGTNKGWEIPAGEEWLEHTWKIDNANFVGGWGWNFRTDIGGSPGMILIKEVRVKKVPAEKK